MEAMPTTWNRSPEEFHKIYSTVVMGRRVEKTMTDTQAWNYAVGMIKVDGLEPTPEFKEYIEKEKKGEITMADVKQYLDKRYKVKQ